MAQQIGAFAEYDPNGRPYIGLLLSSDGVTLTFYLAHKHDARDRVRKLASELNKLVAELENMPDKLVEAKGSIDGILNKPGREHPATAQGRAVQRPRGPRA